MHSLDVMPMQIVELELIGAMMGATAYLARRRIRIVRGMLQGGRIPLLQISGLGLSTRAVFPFYHGVIAFFCACAIGIQLYIAGVLVGSASLAILARATLYFALLCLLASALLLLNGVSWKTALADGLAALSPRAFNKQELFWSPRPTPPTGSAVADGYIPLVHLTLFPIPAILVALLKVLPQRVWAALDQKFYFISLDGFLQIDSGQTYAFARHTGLLVLFVFGLWIASSTAVALLFAFNSNSVTQDYLAASFSFSWFQLLGLLPVSLSDFVPTQNIITPQNIDTEHKLLLIAWRVGIAAIFLSALIQLAQIVRHWKKDGSEWAIDEGLRIKPKTLTQRWAARTRPAAPT